MRTLRAASAAGRKAFEISPIVAWSRVITAVLVTTAMVLGASLVAVAMSLP
jgi:hypothetical protein